MGVYRTLAALALISLVPLGAAAAPAGKVIIAQGVDPTTLDMMNQSETPASNLGRHIFDTLYERDQSLKVVRSEEHTSELQSRLHLVCRLLLEKKKNKIASHGNNNP